jgi:hypothetical protein
VIKESDANTAFHHAQATIRLISNNIRIIQSEGVQTANHEGKISALTDYFASIISQPGSSSWSFDLSAIFMGQQTPSPALLATFSTAEVKVALRSMNRHSAPEPDGFGLAFYVAAWDTVMPQVMPFMTAFHDGQVQLERINRSFMALLPKKSGAVQVDAFKPISLQNCSIKFLQKP